MLTFSFNPLEFGHWPQAYAVVLGSISIHMISCDRLGVSLTWLTGGVVALLRTTHTLVS